MIFFFYIESSFYILKSPNSPLSPNIIKHKLSINKANESKLSNKPKRLKLLSPNPGVDNKKSLQTSKKCKDQPLLKEIDLVIGEDSSN